MPFKTIYDYDECLEKGIKPPYMTTHNMVRKRLPKPDKCSVCGKKRKLDLCNKSGEYSLALDDWFYACRSCHFKHDFNEEKREKLVDIGRNRDFSYMQGNKHRAGQECSKSHKKKLSKALKGKTHSPERRAAIAAGRQRQLKERANEQLG